MRQLFRVFIPASLVGLILSEIALIFLCYLAGSWLVSRFVNLGLDLGTFLFVDGGLFQIILVVICVGLGIYFQDLYSNVQVRSIPRLVQQICLVIGVAFLIQALFAYARRPEWSLPRWAMIFGSLLALFVIPAWRVLFSRVILNVIRLQRVLFLGASPVSQDIARYFSTRPEVAMSVLGYLEDPSADGELVTADLPGGRLIGEIKDLATTAETLKPDLIVVGVSERRSELPMSEMVRLRFSGVQFEEAAVTFEAAFGRVSTRQLSPSRLVYASDLGPRQDRLFWHSLYSILVATILLIVFSPVMLILAIIIRLTSPGPIFHRQIRVGLNGQPFNLYKFRSMYVDAEARTGPVWASKDDPRVTGPGKWMRRFRFDELPQLFNVIRNEMALVGPRPERPQFVTALAEKIPYYNYRHCVKPGITGWAQINYKYGDTFEDAVIKLEYDLYYIKNLAFSLDLYIIFHTLKVMLISETAH